MADRGRFGPYGGSFAPETLMAPLTRLAAAFSEARKDARFRAEFDAALRDYAGRPTPLFLAARLSEDAGGAKILFKREDLLHTGAHKINNAIGQALLARRMGKTRLIAETGAGQHGVATATVAAWLGFDCVVYMGSEDTRRQAVNVARMRRLGAEVREVEAGSKTLKDAINEAMRDWSESSATTHYVLGSALGPHPYPSMVAWFHRAIGREARAQCLRRWKKLPKAVVACVGGGSNAIGIFQAFLRDRVGLWGVEAGGRGPALGDHAARFAGGRIGILHGTRTWVLQDPEGQIAPTHSVSAGLDYPAVGPQHAALREARRVRYVSIGDAEALAAFDATTRREGIVPALESAHAIAFALRLARSLRKRDLLLVNLSGRGDKDLAEVERLESE
ncbi:MAG TPA: tryptophan synthase subunit beta [Thermoanaerobaculia bacterium]|nr:tryptophan synthase subunit beta [Thermoanaerobaculia bacterium]